LDRPIQTPVRRNHSLSFLSLISVQDIANV
jgi:hypothetical protein